eukprot:1612993-Pyramimonas_sp.AAC.1
MLRLPTVPDGVRGPSDRAKTAEEAPKKAQRRPRRLDPQGVQEGLESAPRESPKSDPRGPEERDMSSSPA